jgi:hypothetical protein
VGHFVQTMTGQDLGEELLAIVLGIAQARVLYRGEYGNPDREAVCVSHDLATGVGSPGGECASCPFAARSEVKDEDDSRKAVPAPCGVRHLYVVLPVRFTDGIADDGHLRRVEDAGPAVFRMQGVSRRNAQALDTMLAGSPYGEGYRRVYRFIAQETKGRGSAIVYAALARPAHKIRDSRLLDQLRFLCHQIAEVRESILPPLPKAGDGEVIQAPPTDARAARGRQASA